MTSPSLLNRIMSMRGRSPQGADHLTAGAEASTPFVARSAVRDDHDQSHGRADAYDDDDDVIAALLDNLD